MKHAASRIAALILLLTTAGLVASCEDGPTAPELVQAWALESWFGQEPPLLFHYSEDPDGVTCEHVLVSSEIELRTERRVDMIDALTVTCGDDDEPEPYTDTRRGTWTIEGDSVFLQIETGNPIIPVAPLNGRVVDDRLRFEYEVYSEVSPIDTVAIVYRRVL